MFLHLAFEGKTLENSTPGGKMGVDGAAPGGPIGKKGTESNAGTANSHPHGTDGPGDTRTCERARCSLKAPPFPITTAPWSH